MEAIVCPLDWNDWPEQSQSVFKGLRSHAGEELVLDKNTFVELILPNSIMRDLTAEEMSTDGHSTHRGKIGDQHLVGRANFRLGGIRAMWLK